MSKGSKGGKRLVIDTSGSIKLLYGVAIIKGKLTDIDKHIIHIYFPLSTYEYVFIIVNISI